MAAIVKRLTPIHKWSESQIKSLAQTEPKTAMTAVIEQYRDRLFYHVICIVHDSDQAHDLVQEAFIRAVREHRFFDETFRQKAWLYRVVTNLSYNHIRNRNRRAAILKRFKLPIHKEPSQLSDIFQDETSQKLLKDMQKLTKDHQQILVLRYFDDLSYAEISSVLDVALGTVMSRLSRAKSCLRDVMESAS
jgi:RNA polymerase sigma-70 factor (ECF subfamily)